MNKEILFFSYFNLIHLQSLFFVLFLSLILLLIPKFFKKMNNTLNYNSFLKKYSIFLGLFLSFAKIFDSIYRILYQNETILEVHFLYLCNFALAFSILYLFFRTNTLFNLAYYFSFGVIPAIMLPAITFYHSPIYVYSFMTTHILELVAVIFGLHYFKEEITFNGFKNSVFALICIFIYAFIYNYIFNTNAMFLNEHIISFVSFIQPIWLYRVILILVMISFLYLMYLLSFFFKKK